ncbi:MAG: ATP-binding protein [Armatimonadetes bacterium]|nr:ATP-binding protein [Armatimonadota bacterium]
MYPRQTTCRIAEAWADTPVVVLHGPRQAGKTTLVRQFAAEQAATYVTLDDLVPRRAAVQDPEAFLAGLGEAAVIDEVQLAPELFRAIKANVDRDRRPGRFLLTGSADLALLPAIAESLAGRVERHILWPLSEAEIQGVFGDPIARLFAAAPPLADCSLVRHDYLELSVRGGFPEAVERSSPRRRGRWFESYLATMIERDLRQLANIHGLLELPRLLRGFAERAAGLLNYADLSRDVGLERTTLTRYLDLLELAFLIDRLPAWHRNASKRLRRSPKGLFVDSGLLAHLLDAGEAASPAAERKAGQLLENFAVMEIRKLLAASEVTARGYHYRTDDGAEVDLVLERPGGSLLGIEIKSAAAVADRDFRGLRSLQEAAGTDFCGGVVLHTGRQAAAFGERLWALPLGNLWSAG